MTITIGQAAPPFHLPSAQGPDVDLDDGRGRSHLILLFAKGMACGFCRQKMSQLARGLPRFRELGAEIAMITPTTVERGRFYARSFPLPFPYLCDPEYRAYEAYGLVVRPHSVAWRVGVALRSMRAPVPETDLGAPKPTFGDLTRLLNDDDLGFFIIDRARVVRFASAGNYTTFEGTRPVAAFPIPSNDAIVRELDRCQAVGQASAV